MINTNLKKYKDEFAAVAKATKDSRRYGYAWIVSTWNLEKEEVTDEVYRGRTLEDAPEEYSLMFCRGVYIGGLTTVG